MAFDEATLAKWFHGESRFQNMDFGKHIQPIASSVNKFSKARSVLGSLVGFEVKAGNNTCHLCFKAYGSVFLS